MDNEAIVNSIKNLCKNEDISASQLEKEIGLSQGLISKWMKTTPSLDKIIDIADYFHKSVDEVIGRNINMNDELLAAIYHKTNMGRLKWNKVGNNNPQIIAPKMAELYDEEVYTELYYFADVDGAYLTVRCFSQYNKTLNPKELELYIQPSDDSNRVYQEYSTKQLLPLWVLILNKSSDVPDDVKAENIKQKLMMPTLFEKVERMNAYVNELNMKKNE